VNALAVGLAINLVAVTCAIAELLFVKRFLRPIEDESHNEVAGFFYSAVGLVYGVILAYVVVVVWQQLDRSSDIAQEEANKVAGIYNLANHFAEPDRIVVQRLARSYAESVIDDEWPMLAEGKSHPKTAQLANELRNAIGKLRVETPRDQVLYDQALDRYHVMSVNRRSRILQSRAELHPVMWIMLVGGGMLTIAFTYAFQLRSRRFHAALIAGLTVTITSIIYIISVADVPFRGDVTVTPDAFVNAVASFAPPD